MIVPLLRCVLICATVITTKHYLIQTKSESAEPRSRTGYDYAEYSEDLPNFTIKKSDKYATLYEFDKDYALNVSCSTMRGMCSACDGAESSWEISCWWTRHLKTTNNFKVYDDIFNEVCEDLDIFCKGNPGPDVKKIEACEKEDLKGFFHCWKPGMSDLYYEDLETHYFDSVAEFKKKTRETIGFGGRFDFKGDYALNLTCREMTELCGSPADCDQTDSSWQIKCKEKGWKKHTGQSSKYSAHCNQVSQICKDQLKPDLGHVLNNCGVEKLVGYFSCEKPGGGMF